MCIAEIKRIYLTKKKQTKNYHQDRDPTPYRCLADVPEQVSFDIQVGLSGHRHMLDFERETHRPPTQLHLESPFLIGHRRTWPQRILEASFIIYLLVMSEVLTR